MHDYIISLKPIFLIDIIGAVLGYLSSCRIDYFFKEENRTNNGDKRAFEFAFWLVIFVAIVIILDISFAAMDYSLRYYPAFAYRIENRSAFGGFMWTFLCGMSNTLIRIYESAFAKYKKD